MKYYLLFTFLVFTISCNQNEEVDAIVEEPTKQDFIPDYAFFTAGHAYGHPSEKHVGLHTPFVNQIPFINEYPDIEFGVLTGDVVRRSTQAYWDSVRIDIDRFSIPIYIAAGNHDRGALFEKYYPYYQSFTHRNDLFIIISPTNWNIEGPQKEFLISTLEEKASEVNNVFIFLHELIWWSPDNKFKNIEINYRPHYAGASNYWTEISPILKAYSNRFVLYAGDLGATDQVDSYMYYKYDNITLMASGMGGRKKDNIIITEVSAEGELRFKLLKIDSKLPVELAKLNAYSLP